MGVLEQAEQAVKDFEGDQSCNWDARAYVDLIKLLSMQLKLIEKVVKS